jgi:hypothetical protein
MMIFDSKKETTKFFMPSQKKNTKQINQHIFFTLEDLSVCMSKYFLLRHFFKQKQIVGGNWRLLHKNYLTRALGKM